MSIFAIRHLNGYGDPDYYVGVDMALWDWLKSDDNVKSERSTFVVTAPDRYVFNSGKGLVEYLPSYGEVGEFPDRNSAFSRKQYLRKESGPAESWKTLMLIRHTNIFTQFSSGDFSFLNIDESAIHTLHYSYRKF